MTFRPNPSVGPKKGPEGGGDVWDACRGEVWGEGARAGEVRKVAKPENAADSADDVAVDDARWVVIRLMGHEQPLERAAGEPEGRAPNGVDGYGPGVSEGSLGVLGRWRAPCDDRVGDRSNEVCARRACECWSKRGVSQEDRATDSTQRVGSLDEHIGRTNCMSTSGDTDDQITRATR